MIRSVLPLQVEGKWGAIDALSAREVLGSQRWVPLPGAQANLPGVLPWNGRAVAFIDLGAVLAIAPAAQAPRSRTVICERGGCTFALQADSVREVAAIDSERFRPAEIGRHRFAASETDLDGALLSVLDLDALLASVLPGAT